MKKKFSKILGVGLAVVLAISLMIVAAPPQDSEVAATPDVTFRLSPAAAGVGTACWDTEHKEGTSSVKLQNTGSAGSISLEFVPEPGVTLADLDDIVAAPKWSFWHHSENIFGQYAQLELRFTSCYNDDPDGEGAGHVDVTLMALQNMTGAGDWVEQTFVATDTPAWVYWGNAADGTGFTNHPGSDAGVADLKGIEGLINVALLAATGENASAWELTRVKIELWEAGARTCYIDDITIAGTTYDVEQGPEYWMDPEIAYNVKTAEETFTVHGPCGPLQTGTLGPFVAGEAYVVSWSVEKGCGVPGGGDVTTKTGTGDPADETNAGDNFITVRLNTKGDAHICALIDKNADGNEGQDPGDLFEVCAEKKWGDIYCTELTRGALVDDECCVTEYVEASFLWDDCVVEVELPADNAVVDWWLMDINALAAVEALEAELGADPCDVDGGCGTYIPDFFEYDVDGDGTIQVDEVFDSPGDAMLEIYAEHEFTALEKVNTYISPDVTVPADETHETTTTGVDGKTAVLVTLAQPTSAILVTLTDYPIDKHGQNTVCIQHETWIIVPPPTIEKLPNILWAGEKDVVEWRLDVTSWNVDTEAVVFYLETPSVGTFETLNPDAPTAGAPAPGFAYKDMAWGLVEVVNCPTTGSYYAARTVLHSDKQGKSNVIAQWLTKGCGGWEITAQQGFLVYFLAFEEVVLVNMGDPSNDAAWENEGVVLSELGINDSSLLRLRVKGFFEDPVMKSPRPEKEQDVNGDGIIDIILPAGRWILPDDYPTMAIGKLMWDLMDTPVDDIVSWLDDDGDQIETLGLDDEVLALALPTGITEAGAYGDGACFESPLYDATLTTAERWAAYLASVNAFGPVIGPFSKLEAVNADGTGWDIDKPPQPGVPKDPNEIDDFTGGLFAGVCRTTVVPDGLITAEDANMPPAEILFAVTYGTGLLRAVNKADLYQRPETCVFDTDSVDGVVYTNPYYWQEIPANIIIPPMVGSGLAGYEWDSWDADINIDGPYRFWDGLNVWTADKLNAKNIFGLTTVPTTTFKTYTDNRGEAWVEFTQKDFDFSVIEAVATFPYLIGDHLPVVSNPVIKLSDDLKDIKLFVDDLDPVDLIRKVLYVFVRNYDGNPAACELVEWTIDGPYGVFEAFLVNTCGACTNECYDDASFVWDCQDCAISTDGKYALNCTRDMTSSEITYFVDEGVFASASTADDYAITGIVVLSSFCEDVDVPIVIYDCWEGVIIPRYEDEMVTGFCETAPPGEPGDANGDGVVDALDITKVERIIAGLDAETTGADANEDGVVDALDITMVEMIIAGLA